MGEKKTYIVNIDGMRADYFNATGHQGCLTPTLVTFAEQGVRFSNCNDILPANTCTNHTAILTSTHAGSNGILGAVGYYGGLDFNHFKLSRKYGAPTGKKYQHHHLQMPTIYNAIKANNRDLITAFITSKNWLGNILADQDCDITIFPQNTPENRDQHKPNPNYVTPCEGFVLGGTAHPEDNELLPRFYFPKKGEIGKEPPGSICIPIPNIDTENLPSDTWVIDQALKCVDRDNPDFIYMVLMNMDFAGHLYGAFQEKIPDETTVNNLCVFRNPDATRDQLYLTDREIKRFIDHLKEKGLFENARIIITADHGMDTMKSVFSGLAKKNMLYWLLERLHLIQITPKHGLSTPKKLVEELDIDIRRILAKHGITMRASQPDKTKWYNKSGQYDWCFSDGGPVCYLYNVSAATQERIAEILRTFTINENGTTVHPVWKVLTEKDMDYTIDEYTGYPFHLKKGNYDQQYDHIWPCVMIFLRPHYMVPFYNDHVRLGLTPLRITMKIPGFVDLRTAMGAHGTYSEHHVPLIFVSPSEPEVPFGINIEEQVSVLDIIPTITALNRWPPQQTFEGKPLFTVQKNPEKPKKMVTATT